MLRFLFLAQPTDLQTDGLTFRYSHPNNSRTEVGAGCGSLRFVHYALMASSLFFW